MALREQTVRLRFAGGIETKMDSKAVPTTKLLALENGVFTKAVSIVKRNGYEDLGHDIVDSIGQLPSARRLLSHRDIELLAATRNRCYSHQPSLDKWADAGPLFSVIDSDRSAVRTGTQQTMPDHATNRGIRAYAWEDSAGGVWWCSVDSSTGRVCRAPEQLDANGQKPRCVAVGDVLHVYWANPAQHGIYVVICNPATPSVAVVPMLLVEDLNTANPCYDAEPTTFAGSPSVITWAEASTTNFRVALVHAGGALGSPATGLPTAYRELASLSGALSVSAWRPGAAAKLAVTALTNAGGAKVRTFTYSIVDTGGGILGFQLTSTTDVDAAAGAVLRIASVMMDDVDATSGEPPVWVAWEVDNAAPSKHLVRTNVVHGVGALQTQRSVCLVSRAWQFEGDAFATVVHDTTYFNTYVSERLSDFFPVGRHIVAGASGMPTRIHVSSVQSDYVNAPHIVAMVLPWRERLASKNANKFTETGIRYLELDFDNDDSHQYASLGEGTYLAGACPLHYDGRVWTEQGFHVGPELIVAVPAAGGAMTSALKYEYRAWYEWTDAQGEIHRGPTSIGTAVAMGELDTQVTLTLPTLRLTTKRGARICVARSLANDSTAFYRVSSLDPSTAGAVNGYIANDPTIDTVTFIDRMADDVLFGETDAQEPLYTNGGILSTDPSQVSGVIAGSKSRLFFSDPSNGNLIRFSQEIDDGYGVELPPELTLKCDPYGGDVTGLLAMDEQVAVFKERTINKFGGDGPLSNGDSSQVGFSAPSLVTSDCGCTDPASIVLTPVGIMFKSAKGIMLVDRSWTVTYVGADVEKYNAQKVRRATLIPDRTQVLFLTDNGMTLLYDYAFGQWSTYTNHEGLDAVVVGGRYHYLRTDGRIFRETPGVYSDAGKAIVMKLETAWIHMLDHLQGWQHFWQMLVIGDSKSAHQLAVQYRTEYVSLWSDPAYLDATNATNSAGWITGDRARPIGEEPIGGSVYGEGPYGDGPYGGTAPGLYQWRAHLGLVGQAIQFRFSDYEQVGSPGAGFELSELCLTGGVKGNIKRPFQAARST